jgi:hypothetical protein
MGELTMRRFLAVLLAALMAIGWAIPAQAAGCDGEMRKAWLERGKNDFARYAENVARTGDPNSGPAEEHTRGYRVAMDQLVQQCPDYHSILLLAFDANLRWAKYSKDKEAMTARLERSSALLMRADKAVQDGDLYGDGLRLVAAMMQRGNLLYDSLELEALGGPVGAMLTRPGPLPCDTNVLNDVRAAMAWVNDRKTSLPSIVKFMETARASCPPKGSDPAIYSQIVLHHAAYKALLTSAETDPAKKRTQIAAIESDLAEHRAIGGKVWPDIWTPDHDRWLAQATGKAIPAR